jgi:hypothetical protein
MAVLGSKPNACLGIKLEIFLKGGNDPQRTFMTVLSIE